MNMSVLTEAIETAKLTIIERDSIENCVSHEWKEAHRKAKDAANAKNAAFEMAYKSGVIQKPYWA